MKILKRIPKKISIETWVKITTFLIVGIMGHMVYALCYPFNPLEVKGPVKVITKEVKSGDPVIVEFDFIKNTSITPEISISLVDGVIYNLPTISPSNHIGEIKGKRVSVMEVPMTIPCGEYHIHWTAKYKYNALRTVEVKYESEKFRVNSKLCSE